MFPDLSAGASQVPAALPVVVWAILRTVGSATFPGQEQGRVRP